MPKKYSGNRGGHSGGRRSDMESSARASGQRARSGYYGEYDPNKGALQEAQVTSFLSGLPIVGGFVRGIQQARYMDDYYKNTGMVPKYPGYTMSGYSGLGSFVGNSALAAATRGSGSGYTPMAKLGHNDTLDFYNYMFA